MNNEQKREREREREERVLIYYQLMIKYEIRMPRAFFFKLSTTLKLQNMFEKYGKKIKNVFLRFEVVSKEDETFFDILFY